MDETSLRALFERAVADRPPAPRLVPNSVRAGAKLRKRRRLEAVVGSFAAIALIAAVVPAAAGVFGPIARPTAAVGGAFGTAYAWLGVNTVVPIRLSTGSTLAALKFPGRIASVAAAPDGKTVYVFSTVGNSSATSVNYVTAISNATGKAGRPIRLLGNGLTGGMAWAQIAPNGKFAYTTESVGSGTAAGNALVAINLETGVERKLADTDYYGLAVTPDGRTGYESTEVGALSTLSDIVVAVNLATGTLLPPIKVRAPGGVGSIAITPDGRTAYAVSTESGNGRAWVTPIDTGTNIAAKPIEARFGPDAPGDVFITVAPDGKTAYLSGTGPYLSPVNLAAGRALKPIKIAGYFNTLEISPDSKVGYEQQYAVHAVQLFNLASGRLLRKAELPGSYRQAGAAGFFAPSGSTLYVPAAIYRSGPTTRSALFPVQIATQHVGRPILLAGNIQETVFIP